MTYSGIVIHGDGEGRRLGYPTANIAFDESITGIFAGVVMMDDIERPAAIFASQRRPILEAHILDFDGDIYGKAITVTVRKKVREERVFASHEALIAQIAQDIRAIRVYFAEESRASH